MSKASTVALWLWTVRWSACVLGTVAVVLASGGEASACEGGHDWDDDDQHHDGSAGCQASLELRIEDFLPRGAQAPSARRVFVGRIEILPGQDDIYRIPLTDSDGHWIVDAFDRGQITHNGLPHGVYLVVRLGHGRVLQGLYGYLQAGTVSLTAKSSAVGAEIKRVRNYRPDPFERQGDGIAVPGNPGQDEFVRTGGEVVARTTVRTSADFLVMKLRCAAATDKCQGVVCTAADQCHEAGTCDPATGLCSNPPMPDGSSCNNGDACTQADTCQSGVCVSGSPVVCHASDQCHDPGVCDPATGQCSNPIKANGSPCDDGDACTQVDTCQEGLCLGSQPVTCPASDQCHAAGVCDPLTGWCSDPIRENGSPCDDADACTHLDTCQEGICVGAELVTCSASDQCHEAGTCDSNTGLCSNPAREEGTSCDDGDACTQTDTCQAGACTGSNPVTCAALDQCHEVGACDPANGQCSNPAKPDGAACNDGNACNQTDTCQTGACVGSNPVTCTALDQCHDAGTCEPTTGHCSNPAKPNGTPCNDGNACTQTDTCQAGGCTGSNPVTCAAQNPCHEAGTCDPASGQCTHPVKADGTSCSTTTDACRGPEVCRGGTCASACGSYWYPAFSDEQNPTGPWSYGWATSPGAALHLFTELDVHENQWMGYTEYTWHSGETTATLFSGGPELLATPGASGELVIVRFTAPWSGAYSVFGWFGASYPGTAEVAVLLSGTELFRRSLEQEGGGSSAFYSSILDLSAGQTLDFLVGPGAETSADDGAYVEINIIQDPDPTQCPSSGPPTCNDENPCTEDGCSAAAGCTHTPVANGYWCWDAEGHSGTCQSGTCFVEPPPDCTNDHTPPSIAITSPANGSFVRTSYPTITTSTDDPKATVVISGRPLVEGENTVTATATDPCGNSASTSITLVLDTTRPVVTISGVQDGAYYNTDVQPVIEVTDRNLVTVQRWLNGAPYAGEPITIDGSYQLWVKGVDAAQNFTDVIIRFVIDKLAPQIYIAGVPPTSRTPVTPVVQISDSYLATSEILLDGASFTSGTPVTTDGSHLLVARATDRAGNSSERQVSFFIDQSPPALVVTAPAEGAVVTTPSVAVTGTVADLSAVTVTVNAVDVPATAGAFATTLPVASGTNTVTVAATDALGNVSVVVRHFTGCTPRTCGSQGKDCGPMPDGCGGTLDCGTCAVPQTCGGGGIPNVCGGAPLPDPVTVAPPVDPTVATNLAAATSFLYSGPNALQNGVAPGALDPKRVALLRGKVFTRELTPLSGARVTLLGEPQLGGTWTREDGAFDLVVNGGELTVHFEKPGYFPAQRQVALGWQETQTLPDVVLLSQDSQVTLVDLSSAASLPQVARGSPVEDTDGARQQTLFFPAGTLATMELPDGTSQPLPILSVRMTEYTVGASGPKAMPAELPPGVGYTYAVELNADEAVAAGALHVRFNQPIVSYTENFLNLPTGTPVPLGEYDRDRGVWVPAPSGRVIQILSIGADGAELDLDGSGTPASPAALAALQITGAERFELAALYAPGQSLWRVLIPHFTRPWDKNMRISLPCGGKCPPNASLVAEMPLPKPDCLPGSIIEAQNQVLGEAAGITGTPFTLHYRSNRVWGHKVGRRARLRVSGDELPTGLLAILVEVHIAGRSFEYRLPSTPNQLFTFEWDGLDAYGRRLQGLQPATARIGYEYQPVYVETDQFGYTAGPAIMLMEARQTLAVWQTLTFLLGTWEARALGLGGWTLDAHHAYDPQGLALYRGDGASRRGLGLDQGVGRTVAGTGGGGFSGDNGPAADAALHRPQALATDGRGNLYIADTGNNRVRKVGTDGRITTLAGGGAYCYGAAPCGDGFDATSAWLQAPTGVAVDDRGNVYIADWEHHRVRKVGPDGIITTVAGTGVAGFSGDGGPARSAELRQPRAVAADSYGNVYIADTGNERIRRVSADGIIRTIAGSGEPGGESGDGGPATEARLGGPLGIAVDGQGNVYVASDWGARVRKVDASSRITAFAGKDRQWCYWYGWCCTGEDCQATEVNLVTVRGLAVDRDGSVYLTSAQQVRKVGPDGIIRTVAGTGNAGSGGENGPPLGMELNAPWALALDPHGQLYVAENYGNRVRKVAPALPRYTGEAFALVSEDGTELYAFDAAGRHLRTRDALTNVTLYELGYDSGGLLTTVTDAYNNETRIERDSEGIPTAIVAPGGQRTALTLHPSGYLATVANPAQETTGFTYYGNDGLLETLTKPRGGVYRFTYDTLGRLTQDADPATGSLSLDRTDGSGAAYSVQATTAMGRVSGYAVDYLPSGAEQRTETDPSGKQTVARRFPNESREVTLPDGTVTTLTRGPDPRFGMQAPMVKSLSVRTPSGLTLSATANRSVTLSNPNDATTLVTQTDTVTVNGKSHTSLYDAALRRVTTTSPMGRQRVAYLDEKGRLSQVQVPGFAPVSFGHDDRGRLETITAGTGPAARAFTLVYDAQNRLERIIDPRNQTTLFGYDNADRVRREVRPDSRETLATYDVNGNLATLTPPGKPSHTFGYTPVDLEATYAPPDVGIGNVTTSYAWNLDRQLELVTRPDGVTIDPAYDLGGRLATVTHPGGQESYAYNPTTGKLATIAAPDATITYAYDGLLLAGTTWSGGVTGTVARTYDNDFRAMAIKLNGASLATYGYDADGLLTQAGALAITRDPQNGLVTGTTLGAVADSYAYNALGEATSYQATAGGSPLLSISYARDELGRISTKTETIEGASTTYGYTCDLAGRLVEVTKDGTPHAQYTYDASGNRLSLTSTSGSVTGTYDAQDRLRQYGATTYTYNAHGSLETKTTAAGMTAYGYDALGNLRSVLLPDNTLVEYLVDGLNRRIGRKVNGVVVKRCLYLDRLRPIAELDGAGNVVITFVYASGSNSPAFMVKGGVAYRIIKDHLGSPRLVVDAATGAVAQRMDFDEYGNVLLDTNPGFQPIGFAGGLYDPDTGLVRFGARDYDAEMGRWTAKDPIRLAGGDTNLYAYVGNDPVNFIDPSGLFFQAAWQAIVNAAQRVAQFARDAARSLGEGLKNVWDWSQRQGQKIIDWIKDFSRDQSGAINVCAEGAKRFDPNQQALIELAKEAQRRGVSLPDAQTLLQWAKEYGLRARDDIGTSHWIGGPHIHIGPVSHIPVRP